MSDKKTQLQNEIDKQNIVKETGQVILDQNSSKHRIRLVNIIGEIEGHDCLPNNSKTTKYEHLLPSLAAIEDDASVDGVLVLLNTIGGDVEAGLAIAEMIASISKPVVTLVLGGGHSMGVPLAVSGDYSFIVPTATMIVHPIRINGTVLGVKQNYEYIDKMQERILAFTATHATITKEALQEIMMNTTQLTKDIGTMLVGREAVDIGLIDEIGGIAKAIEHLHQMIDYNLRGKRGK